MKERIAVKLAYVGGGAGLVLFLVFGLMFGSFIGGVVGLNISGMLFGMPVEPGIIARMIIAASMILGVMVTALISVTLCSACGWLVGRLIETITAERAKEAEVKTK
jgi:hypothetical protein